MAINTLIKTSFYFQSKYLFSPPSLGWVHWFHLYNRHEFPIHNLVIALDRIQVRHWWVKNFGLTGINTEKVDFSSI